jgi:hypothetical protein
VAAHRPGPQAAQFFGMIEVGHDAPSPRCVVACDGLAAQVLQ